MQADILNSIREENRKRWVRLLAQYNPDTGEGLNLFPGQDRVKLEIPDFAVPVQWVPRQMMKVKLVKGIVKAGGIQKYIDSHKWSSPEPPSKFDIERQLRRIRHKYDFTYWAFWCIRIKRKKGGRIRFKLNYPQLIVLAECERMRLAGEPIELVILKARQWGGSTFCIFYQTWLMFKWDEFHSFAIAAHVQTASETILTMLKRAIETYPVWDLGLPDDTVLKLAQVGTSGHTYAVKDNKNNQVLEGLIYIGTAEKPDTLRSKDIAGAHYSEVGIWPDTPEKKAEDLIADIQEGIADGPLSMQVLESTAKSSDDFFHDTWVGDGYAKVFIPWFYIEWDTRPIRNETEDEFIEWLYTHKDDTGKTGWRDSGQYYWWLWELGATLEGINWYRYRRLKISFSKMCNEAPSTAEQAFIAAGKLVFDPFLVQAMASKCKEPLMVGDLISAAHEGPEVIQDIQFVPNSSGNLRIWEEPDDSPVADRYVVAVDIGGPNDTSDYSSVRVLDRLMTMPDFGLGGRPNVVAEMHYHVDHDVLAYDALRLAAWYNNALLVIESNTLETKDKNRDVGGDGFEYILDIVAKIYSGHLYARRKSEDSIQDGIQGKWGFHTNVSTKPKIIDNLKACIRDGLWYEPSKLCTNELAVYIEDHNKFTAPARAHDDVLMATAILLWISYKEMPLPSWIKQEPTRKKKVRSKDNMVNL